MHKKGCEDGCIHNKPIKLEEMAQSYSFRCAATGYYMKKCDIKKKCRFFKPEFIIRVQHIEDFLE